MWFLKCALLILHVRFRSPLINPAALCRPSKPRARSRSAEGAKRRRSEAADGTPPATAGEDAGGALVALPAGEPVAMDAELTPEELQMMMAMGIPFVSGIHFLLCCPACVRHTIFYWVWVWG